MSEKQYLAVRRDDYGNLVMLWRPGTTDFAWNITEAEAIAATNYAQRDQTKVHEQSYHVLDYPSGTLREFLKSKRIQF